MSNAALDLLKACLIPLAGVLPVLLLCGMHCGAARPTDRLFSVEELEAFELERDTMRRHLHQAQSELASLQVALSCESCPLNTSDKLVEKRRVWQARHDELQNEIAALRQMAALYPNFYQDTPPNEEERKATFDAIGADCGDLDESECMRMCEIAKDRLGWELWGSVVELSECEVEVGDGGTLTFHVDL